MINDNKKTAFFATHVAAVQIRAATSVVLSLVLPLNL